MLITIFTIIIQLIILVFDILFFIINEIICCHWYIRKTYQTSLYRFNSYHELNLWLRAFRRELLKLDFVRNRLYTYMSHFEFLRLRTPIMDKTVTDFWYGSCWLSWCGLTYHLFYHHKLRDLGPSHQVFDYHYEIEMGFYKTVGLRIISVWTVWTYVANTVFIDSIFFFLHKFFILEYIRNYWYRFTLYSCIEMYLLNYAASVYETTTSIWFNYNELKTLHTNYMYYFNSLASLEYSQLIVLPPLKPMFLWFPWYSFFNYLTILGLFYILTLLAIYNSENTYYIVLYTIFLIFLFSSTLVMLDLDIFAGLLLLIESVVILMLFFLIIYLTPNLPQNLKNTKWKLYVLVVLITTILSIYVYPNLGVYYFNTFSITSYFHDDFYEALNDVFVNDLMGIFTSLYITDSALMVIIGLLLLIASIICVVLVSFFTKLRNYSFKNFLNIFSILKSCYSIIFLRKQNLSKQGRGVASTRMFNKKTFDTTTHTEYREKQEIFEKKKKEEIKNTTNI